MPTLIHEEINSEYSKIEEETDKTLRSNLDGRGFEERWAKGVEVMRKMGIIE